MRRLSTVLLAFSCFAPALPVLADSIPYPNPGHVAPTTATYATSGNGVGIDLYYYGSSASYLDTLQVYDVNTHYLSIPVLANYFTTPGTEVVLGAGKIHEGDQIVFLLDSPAGIFASDPDFSADGINHAYITTFDGGKVGSTMVPAGLFLGFEDKSQRSSDFDYNDLEIITTGVSVTPEPTSLALFGTGILGLAGAVKRRFA